MKEHFWKNIKGYLDHFEVYDLALSKFNEGHFVEIGTYLGRSIAYLAVEVINQKKNIKLDTIDHYGQSKDGSANSTNFYYKTKENLSPIKEHINIINQDSIEASKGYEDNSLELVYIDASHDYESVKNEIIAWLPKVKKGGIISGDDFGWSGVKKAVYELLPEASPIGIKDSNWYYIKK